MAASAPMTSRAPASVISLPSSTRSNPAPSAGCIEGLRPRARRGSSAAPANCSTRSRRASILIGYNLLGSYAYGRLKAGAPIGIVLPRDYTLVLSRAAFIPQTAGTPKRQGLPRLPAVAAWSAGCGRSPSSSPRASRCPDGVDAGDSDDQMGIVQPIPIGPDLLAVTDKHKRQRLLKVWRDTLGVR